MDRSYDTDHQRKESLAKTDYEERATNLKNGFKPNNFKDGNLPTGAGNSFSIKIIDS